MLALLLLLGPVISLDYTGGWAPARISKEPFLAIHADGTICARNPYTKDKARLGTMPKKEVEALVRALSPKIVQLKKWPLKSPITDQRTTVLRVGEKSAKQYALGYLAEQLPKHKEVQGLWAARQRLQRIYNVTMVGGEKKAKAHLATANKALEKAWPKAKPFDLDEMSVYRETVTFRRQEKQRSIAVTLKDGKVHVDKSG
ncbi:MAG: hypothetical protein ACYTHK_06810 [Planctomycetota bacterium]